MLKTKDEKAEMQQNGRDISERKPGSYTPKWLQPDRLDTIKSAEPDKELDKNKGWDKDLE